jgi:methionyl-tRNA synthetase
LNLPTNVPANQYVTFGAEKASASRGVGQSISWYTERLEPDALRYALAAVLPEHQDTDLTDEEIIRRVNEELVATWGNLVNRVLTLCANNFESRVPEPAGLQPPDETIATLAGRVLSEVGAAIEAVELRSALRLAMDGAAEVNAYLNATEPWRAMKQDPQRAGTILWCSIQAIAGIAVALTPFLPHSSGALAEMLGTQTVDWAAPVVPGGTLLGPISPLFTKLDDTALT